MKEANQISRAGKPVHSGQGHLRGRWATVLFPCEAGVLGNGARGGGSVAHGARGHRVGETRAHNLFAGRDSPLGGRALIREVD